MQVICQQKCIAVPASFIEISDVLKQSIEVNGGEI